MYPTQPPPARAPICTGRRRLTASIHLFLVYFWLSPRLAPNATKPPQGMKWMQEPPHVMVFNYGGEGTIKDYPRPGEMAEMTQPWVMWAGSPYEHLMIPVRSAQ